MATAVIDQIREHQQHSDQKVQREFDALALKIAKGSKVSPADAAAMLAQTGYSVEALDDAVHFHRQRLQHAAQLAAEADIRAEIERTSEDLRAAKEAFQEAQQRHDEAQTTALRQLNGLNSELAGIIETKRRLEAECHDDGALARLRDARSKVSTTRSAITEATNRLADLQRAIAQQEYARREANANLTRLGQGGVAPGANPERLTQTLQRIETTLPPLQAEQEQLVARVEELQTTLAEAQTAVTAAEAQVYGI